MQPSRRAWLRQKKDCALWDVPQICDAQQHFVVAELKIGLDKPIARTPTKSLEQWHLVSMRSLVFKPMQESASLDNSCVYRCC
jgi:hypothetical protein